MSIAEKLLLINQYYRNIRSAVYTRTNVNPNNIGTIPNQIVSINGANGYVPQQITPQPGIIGKVNYVVSVTNEIKTCIIQSGVNVSTLSQFAQGILDITQSSSSHTLVINGLDVALGETIQYSVLFDGEPKTSGITWQITSGSSYATINNTGLLTINSSANNNSVTISASCNGASDSKTVMVTYQSGTNSSTEVETTTNEDGTTSQTITTTTTNQDGSSSSTSNTINYDENGNVTGSSQNETTNNVDGSSRSSTTNYDSNGDPTDQENILTDTVGNVDTQNIEYNDSGEPVVTAYTIDTTASDGQGKNITGDGVNTDFYPFDGGEGFEMHIRFRSVKTEQPNPPVVVDTEDTGSNYHFTILASKDPVSPWPGFHIRWTLAKKNYSSGNLYFGYKGKTGNSANRALAISRNNDIYDFTVAYDPTLKKYPSKFRCIDNLNGGATISLNIDFNPLDYGVTLGYNINQQGQPYRYSNVTIYEFSINKL